MMPAMTDHRPWFRSWPPDVPRTLEPYLEVSLFSLLADAAASFPDRPAIAFFGKHLSYRETLAEVERCSAMLVGLGVRQGDRVGLLLPNCPQFLIAFYACQRIGAVAVGNNPLYTQRELSHQLKDAGISVIIVLDQLYGNLGAVRDQAGIREVVATKITDYFRFPLKQLAPLKFKREAKHEGKSWPPVPGDAHVRWWRDLMSDGPVPRIAEVDPKRDPAAFVYTGGTTGLSKGAMLSHFNLVSNARQAAALFSDVRPGEDAIMNVLPFFHSFGMVAMNLGVLRAAKNVMVPRFDLHMVLKTLAKEKPTLFPGVPRIYIALNEAPETKKYDLRSLKACISGAAPLPMAVAKKFEEITGGAIAVEGYGMTECSPVTHVNPIRGTRKEGSIGIPIPDTDAKIVALDEPDRILGVGEAGELCIKGPQVMLGYWNRPDESGLMIRDGWLHSGDIAVMDEDGYFSIVDRMKDMILVSGFNVYPTEVEQVLYQHPKILKLSVVGVPDEVTGEAVKAYVVLKPGESATAEEITAWSRDPAQGLTGYRVPKQIEFRDSLPETLIGKVLRRVLLEEERQKRAAAGA